jgi:beta-1,4-mannosyl-glycoprotein beta-1,4-N-acetylglucosaminyltransferase
MRTVDCFTFFNELDLLEFRLKLLDSSVDLFVLAESNLTHSGKPKPYFFEENKNRFAKWQHKIVYLPVKQTAEGLNFKGETSYNPEGAAWKLENEQRNALQAVASTINDEDRIIISDLDEIPDPQILKSLRLSDKPVVLSMLFHYYFMNCQNTGRERWWNGSIVCTGKQFRETTPQHLRDQRNDLPVIAKAGWHFSYLGGLEKIKYKLQSFAHTEFSKAEYMDDEHIYKSLEEGKDILKREDVSFQFVPLSFYPSSVQKVIKEYPSFVYQKKFSLPEKIRFAVKGFFLYNFRSTGK